MDSSLATCHTCACRVQPNTPQSIIFWRASDESIPKQNRSIGYTQILHAGPSLLARFTSVFYFHSMAGKAYRHCCRGTQAVGARILVIVLPELFYLFYKEMVLMYKNV